MSDHCPLDYLFLDINAPPFLSQKCDLLFTPDAYIQIHIRLDMFMETNNMEQSGLGLIVFVKGDLRT